MKKPFKFETFETLREAEIFVRDYLRYKSGAYKKHLISYSEYWKCYIVSYSGKLIHR